MMMVDIQPQQQQDTNANTTVRGYEVQTITIDMGPDSTTTTEDRDMSYLDMGPDSTKTTEDRDMSYSGEDYFSGANKVSFVED